MAKPKFPLPSHQHGEIVLVLNYRKRPAVWERGTITEVNIRNSWGTGFSVAYRVRLERQTPAKQRRGARSIDCHVGAASVRRL